MENATLVARGYRNGGRGQTELGEAALWDHIQT